MQAESVRCRGRRPGDNKLTGGAQHAEAVRSNGTKDDQLLYPTLHDAGAEEHECENQQWSAAPQVKHSQTKLRLYIQT